MPRQKKTEAEAAKRRLAQQAVQAAFAQFSGNNGLSAKEIEALLAADPALAEAVANFQAQLMLLKIPDDAKPN
jgi:hypothetical protein